MVYLFKILSKNYKIKYYRKKIVSTAYVQQKVQFYILRLKNSLVTILLKVGFADAFDFDLVSVMHKGSVITI